MRDDLNNALKHSICRGGRNRTHARGFGRGTVIAQFAAPDSLSPVEVGTIYDNKTHAKDVSAEIINLAIKGYIKINRVSRKLTTSSLF